MTTDRWHLFEVVGVEIEYMLVHRDTLDVAPLADNLLAATGIELGAGDSDVYCAGAVSWSNELARHVIEFKGTEPFPSLQGVAPLFQREVTAAHALLSGSGARLMPGAMHPWMDPATESQLWPFGQTEIYNTFDRIFDCRGHGWSNLQSTHINLPFANDEEFGRLHAAIRLLLPLLPALAASSPVMDGNTTGCTDNRLRVYRGNCARVPAVTGDVIPEAVFDEAAYRAVLDEIARAIAPLDSAGVLEAEWVNARGAIARFDRNAIEIRVLDCQECPAADIAMIELIVAVLRLIVEEQFSDYASQRAWSAADLLRVYEACVNSGSGAQVLDRNYLRALGISGCSDASAALCWQHLAERAGAAGLGHDAGRWTEHRLRSGTLSEQLIAAIGAQSGPGRLKTVYGELADCVAEGRLFGAR